MHQHHPGGGATAMAPPKLAALPHNVNSPSRHDCLQRGRHPRPDPTSDRCRQQCCSSVCFARYERPRYPRHSLCRRRCRWSCHRSCLRLCWPTRLSPSGSGTRLLKCPRPIPGPRLLRITTQEPHAPSVVDDAPARAWQLSTTTWVMPDRLVGPLVCSRQHRPPPDHP